MRDIGCPRPRGPRRRLRARLGCHPAPASARVAPPAPRRALRALRTRRRRPPRQNARRPPGPARGVRGQGHELPCPRHGCNGRQGAMGDSGGWREGPRTAAGHQRRFAASSGRRPVPRGLPRAASTFRVPGAARPRRAPRTGARAPGPCGRRRGPRAHRDSPTRFLQKPPFMRIYHSAATHKKINTYPSLSRASTPPPARRWRLSPPPILRITPLGRVKTSGTDHHATDGLDAGHH